KRLPAGRSGKPHTRPPVHPVIWKRKRKKETLPVRAIFFVGCLLRAARLSSASSKPLINGSRLMQLAGYGSANASFAKAATLAPVDALGANRRTMECGVRSVSCGSLMRGPTNDQLLNAFLLGAMIIGLVPATPRG